MDNITIPRLTVEDIQKSFQRFTIADYLVLAGMLIGCALIGIYYAFKSKPSKGADEADEYLMGGRNMSVFPVSMSLVASFISGITLLGTPTEMYLHGTEYMFVVIGFTFTGIIFSYMALPVFHDLQLSSTYEYLRQRFDTKVQLVGSILFTINLTCWLPIVIYVPALAFNQVTGVNVHIITPLVCLVCIFYTCVGGLKAVVWTDVVQTFIMVAAMIVIIVKGSFDIGGFDAVWKRNWETDRIEFPTFSLDPTIRHSMLSITVGGTIHFLQNGFINQNMIQRYLTLPSIQHARRALWIFVFGILLFVFICGYAGLLAYATYHDCDPLSTGVAKAKDQVLPLLVMQVLEKYPGLPGLFVAGVFSAALSSLSTGLNSMSAVFLEDFVKPHISKPLSERMTAIILRSVVVVFGVICVALVFVVEKLGSVLQLSMSLAAITSGASFGIFIGGMLIPFINSKGALWGGIIGLIVSAVNVVGAQRALATGAVYYPNKALSVEGCNYDFQISPEFAEFNATAVSEAASSTFPLYRISYLWYTLFGGLVTIIFSLIISYVTGGNEYQSMDHRIFSPLIRRWLPKQTLTKLTHDDKELLEILHKNHIEKRIEENAT